MKLSDFKCFHQSPTHSSNIISCTIVEFIQTINDDELQLDNWYTLISSGSKRARSDRLPRLQPNRKQPYKNHHYTDDPVENMEAACLKRFFLLQKNTKKN